MLEARGEIHGYLTKRELSRASIARWWRTTPDTLRTVPVRELRVMGEFMGRVIDQQKQDEEDAKRGAPTPGRDPRSKNEW